MNSEGLAMIALHLSQRPVVKTGLLIRKPPAEVFEAFADPAVTTQFWFTDSTGRLESGKTVRWDWKMHGVFANVAVKAAEPHARIWTTMLMALEKNLA